MRIKLREIMLRGHRKWQLDYENSGKRNRPIFKSKELAEHEVARLRTGVDSAKALWSKLSQSERDGIVIAYQKAKERGHNLNALLDRSHELQPHIGPLLSEVISELIRVKENAGRSDDYTSNLKIILKQFSAGREAMKVDAVSLADVEKFLDARKLASRSTLRSRLSTLFKFAIRRGYRKDNPCAGLETVTVTKVAPAVFTPKQFTTAVEWLLKHQPIALPWLALSTVCGLRPEEAEKTTEAEINFKEGFVKVEAQTTKVRQRRIVYPKREAMAFLKWALKYGELPLDSQVRKRILAGVVWKNKEGVQRRPGLRHALGFTVWPKDITRHTAASYWLASDGSAAHVADMLGNSERVLKRDYKALVTKAEAVEFWKAVKAFK